VGYCSTLSAWLTGQGEGDALPEVRDFEEVLRWLRDLTPCILRADASDFVEEVYRKRLKYGLDAAQEGGGYGYTTGNTGLHHGSQGE